MGRQTKSGMAKIVFIMPVVFILFIIYIISTCNDGSGSQHAKPVTCEPRQPNRKDGPKSAVAPPRPKKKLSAYLVVLIMTGPQLVERRYTIRETWLQKSGKEVMAKFVVGTAELKESDKKMLDAEQARHKDLLFLPSLKDSFGSLTNKLIQMLTWLDQNVDFQYMLKADDDTYVRLDAMVKELKSKNKEKLYWGFFDGRAHAHRTGRYAETDWVLCDRYLPYAMGGGYVLSSDLVSFIANNAPYLKRYHAEDVSVGSWLAAVDVKREHDPRFDTEFKSRGCRNVYIVTHKQTIQDMRSKYQQLQTTGKLCAKEQQFRLSYVYNWDKVPTDCCERVEGVP
ncbi:beta-1,3-galactosyltransferase 6-like [Acanthaster planci]|uniref:Hexosyltransferase n=1 Tax=Acanthaster planci TaxID=133434 RepID=A0A8B7YAK5_ACAPL|nr:beta-1,3-galactosyltransferase 6-like [Acanthaster planci]XP_022090259.1 beta-1,3-galactosyltransferase 6-like [Acanthaster planci]